MTIATGFYKSVQDHADTAVVFIGHDKTMSAAARSLDDKMNGLISYHLEKQKKFSGKNGQSCLLTAPEGSAYDNIMLLGLGKADDQGQKTCEIAGGKLYLALDKAGAAKANILLDPADKDTDVLGPAPEDLAAYIATGMNLRAYKYDRYKTASGKDKNGDDSEKDTLESVHFILDKASAASGRFDDLEKIIESVHWARDLVNDPPNDLYPDSFAEKIKNELKPLGVEVDILDEKKMEKLGFHAALAVGKGSSRPPRIVVMRWNGTKDKKKTPVAFVGKGITFDTGGINLKPSSGITEMKLDMAGAAAVVGTMKAVASRKARASVVGIVGLAENMPSERAYRPSDVIKSHSGQTIEVLNTDAEGRLVLADCLSYVQEEYAPEFIIDLATLTGAMMVALGFEYCGTFSNEDSLWEKIEKAGDAGNEKLWRMPLAEAYTKEMDSDIADVKNLATNSRYAGACTAAAFLERFVKDGQTWAHMDIAGVAWIKSDTPLCPKPGTGFGVRTLDRLVASYEE